MSVYAKMKALDLLTRRPGLPTYWLPVLDVPMPYSTLYWPNMERNRATHWTFVMSGDSTFSMTPEGQTTSEPISKLLKLAWGGLRRCGLDHHRWDVGPGDGARFTVDPPDGQRQQLDPGRRWTLYGAT